MHTKMPVHNHNVFLAAAQVSTHPARDEKLTPYLASSQAPDLFNVCTRNIEKLGIGPGDEANSIYTATNFYSWKVPLKYQLSTGTIASVGFTLSLSCMLKQG